jgi:hypothetical protein
LPDHCCDCADPIGAVTSVEANNAIHSGSDNKRGVDAVGDRLRLWLDAAGDLL